MGAKLKQLGLVALAAIATGTLLVLALPLGEQAYLAWIMLVPLLVATKQRGFLTGFLAALGAIAWCAFLATSGVFYAHKHFEASPNWTVSVCGIFGFSFSIFFGIYADGQNWKRSALWFGALAVCLEAVLLLKIPAHLALTQYRNWLVLMFAGLGGIWLVSYLVWAANVFIAQDFRKRYGYAILFVALGFALPFVNPFRHPTLGLKVGVAQITDSEEKKLAAAHEQAAKDRPVFVVWPESSGILFTRWDDTSRLKELSAQTAPLITSFEDFTTPHPHNVASLFADGEESTRYEKRRLFGDESKSHTPGTKPVAVIMHNALGCVGLNICYDSCFPSTIRETADLSQVKIIALPTIDPDSPHYFMAAMHAAYTPFRAVENGVAIARADGNFGSMVVDEHGGIVLDLADRQGSATASVSGRRLWTLAGFLGDWFLYICMIATFVPLFLWIHERRQKRQ